MAERFMCADCGNPIRDWDGRNFFWPEVREADLRPLRAILGDQVRIAGRQMCRSCAENYVRDQKITDRETIERIIPWNSLDIGDRPKVPRSPKQRKPPDPQEREPRATEKRTLSL